MEKLLDDEEEEEEELLLEFFDEFLFFLFRCIWLNISSLSMSWSGSRVS